MLCLKKTHKILDFGTILEEITQQKHLPVFTVDTFGLCLLG